MEEYTMSSKLERYNALDGVRVLAMLGILVMHVLANVPYREELSYLYKYIVYFGDFTALFMIVSAFSVNCGYFNRISNGNFDSIVSFYKKRFSKILPFFLTLSIIDVVLSPSVGGFYELLANASLGFGLIPHESITVIGVGWTLGVIFVFYLLYPFFVYCMQSKIGFCILTFFSVFFAFIANEYFGLGKVDFLFCLVYFVVGCSLYLSRNYIKSISRWLLMILMFASGFIFFCVPAIHSIAKLFFFTFVTMYAISVQKGRTILSNRLMSFLTTYSFEIYLCHMVSYRVVEKLNLLQISNNLFFSYLFICFCVFFISLFIAYVFKLLETKFIDLLRNR